MKKLFFWSGSAVFAVLATLPFFAAFEAHVVNVTATIENTLLASTYALDFGTVFPQEKFDKTFDLSLSQSFLDQPTLDDVEYILRQKPKCVRTSQNETLPQFGQVTEDPQNPNIFVCKDEVNYDIMPLLCSYLSKAEVTTDPGAQGGENDMQVLGPLASFHGPISLATAQNPNGWSLATTLAYQLDGRLAKSDQDLSDTWNIDLKVPCFGDHCAQDWATFVAANDGNNNADPNAYIQPIENEHKLFGCDLWLEVTEVSTASTITVVKQVINDDTGAAVAGDFQMLVNGSPVAQGVATTFAPGNYTVTETGPAGYTTTFSGDCDANGQLALGNSQQKTCTVINDDNEPLPANLIVNKVVTNDNGGNNVVSDFSLTVDGNIVVNGATNVFTPGLHTVSESGVSGYVASFSGDCDNSGQVTLVSGQTKTCTITNDDLPANITLVKSVINDNGGTATPAGFTLRIDGVVRPNNTSVAVTANTPHAINEDAKSGYSFVSLTGTDCPAVLGGTATLNEGQSITCTITNDDNPPE